MSTFSWRVLRLPLLITLLWGLLLFTLFRWTAQREDEYTTGLARIQTATLFSSIVDTRDWNANNGGVWVREPPGCPANPWLPEEERTLRAEGGTTLVKVNPAYMTRQIAESFTSTLAGFSARQQLTKAGVNHFIIFILSAFVASLCASSALRFDCTAETAIATSVLFLVPGVPLINGVIDIVEGHVLIGCSRLIGALLLILCIAVGLSVTLLMVKGSLL